MDTEGGLYMLKKWIIAACCVGTLCLTPTGYAAEESLADTSAIDAQIQALTEKKVQQQQAAASRLTDIEKQLTELRSRSNYDAQGAIESLAGQMNALQQQMKDILGQLKSIQDSQTAASSTPVAPFADNGNMVVASSNMYLVNPGPTQEVSYTQDAINSQGNSTMVFAYAPNQLYKIYCRTNYLTDLTFKAGEKITFVGGGDTSSWMLDSAEVDGTPHLYIKPVVATSTTNIIVNTTKHTYQIILNTSDWYNPMVKWSYGAEDKFAVQQQKQKTEKTYTGTLDVTSPDQLNFDYRVEGDDDWKPTMVFDDGKKTFIKFKKLNKKMPVLFVREPGRKDISLVNYKVKDNCYIVDTVFKEAQLKITDKDFIRIIANH
jgi:type IV secretion system protein TrbG